MRKVWIILIFISSFGFAQEKLDGKYILSSNHAEYSESYTFLGNNQFSYSFISDTFIKTYGEGVYYTTNEKITFLFSKVLDFSEEISQNDKLTIDNYYKKDSLLYKIELIDQSTGKQLVAARVSMLDKNNKIMIDTENLDTLTSVIYKEAEIKFSLRKNIEPAIILITPYNYSGYEIPISADSSYNIRLEFNRLKFTYEYIPSGDKEEFDYNFVSESKFRIRKENNSDWKEFTKN